MALKSKKVHVLARIVTMYDGIEFYKTEVIVTDNYLFRKGLVNYLRAELDLPELDEDIMEGRCNPEAWVYDEEESTAMRFVSRKRLTDTEAILYESLVKF